MSWHDGKLPDHDMTLPLVDLHILLKKNLRDPFTLVFPEKVKIQIAALTLQGGAGPCAV